MASRKNSCPFYCYCTALCSTYRSRSNSRTKRSSCRRQSSLASNSMRSWSHRSVSRMRTTICRSLFRDQRHISICPFFRNMYWFIFVFNYCCRASSHRTRSKAVPTTCTSSTASRTATQVVTRPATAYLKIYSAQGSSYCIDCRRTVFCADPLR